MTPALFSILTPLLAWQDFAQPRDDQPIADAATAGIAIVFMILYGLLLVAMLAYVIWAYYVFYTSLDRLPPQFRLMEPAMIFLLLVPFFNIYWIFVLHSRIPRSYQAYFASQNRMDFGDCGEQLGMWAAICIVVPCLNCIPIGLVLEIMFLLKLTAMRNTIPAKAKL